MKKRGILFTSLIIMIVISCTGCVTSSSYLESINIKKYSNTLETALAQTDIKGMVDEYMQTAEGESKNKKAIVIMVDGFRANTIESFYEYGKGIARLAGDGGLYFTQPANIDTDAKIGRGTNMLSIMTGIEPSKMSVMKSSDVKRAEPLSLATSCATKYATGFYTDNINYLEHQLAQELDLIKNVNGFTANAVDDVHKLRDEIVRAVDTKTVVLAAVNDLYLHAGGNYSTRNTDYMKAVINFNSYIEEIMLRISAKTGEAWLMVVTSTFGGEESIVDNKKAHNSTTFLASNKKIENGKFI